METKNFKISNTESQVNWIGKKVTGQHNGTINIEEGNFTFSNDELTGGNVVIDTTSIVILDVTDPATNQQFAGHLASDDFFSIEKFPTASFDVLSVKEISNTVYYLEGNLNIFLFQLLIYTFVIALLLALCFSFVLSKYLFSPIVKITERAKQISSENLHLRLPTKIVNDEVNELANTFNQMLNRIETAFEIQNNFVSNASHELRTPLTTIIGEADLALTKERTVEEYQETIRVILEAAENLDSKTRALLSLAQTGFNGTAQKEDVLRIDQLVWDTKEIVEKLDKRHSITVNVSLLPENPKKLKVKGNYQLLQLALSSIITNASKYSNYQEVTVSIGASDKSVYLLINDSGIGIPTQELKFIYDPFFRASNTTSYEGFGIGLPLTKNIIDLHKGEILVKSAENQGTIVQINLPICTKE